MWFNLSLVGISKLLDSMAMLDWEAEIKNSFKELKLQSATIKSVNGNENVNKNVDDINDSFKFDICVKCVYDSENICKVIGDDGNYNKDNRVCTGFNPDTTSNSNPTECKACDKGNYSKDGKKFINCNCEDDECDKTTGEWNEGKNYNAGFYKDSEY